RREADASLLPARRARGLGRRAPEGARAHLAPAEGRGVPPAADRSGHGGRALRDHSRGGRPILTVTVRELVEQAGDDLQLELVAGATSLDRGIAVPRLQQPGLALAGYLPQLHPDRVQVLGNSEVSYLGTLSSAAARAAVAATGSSPTT